MGVHRDRQLLQFCYTAEVADSVLKLLDDVGLPGELRLRQGWRWWRWSVRALLAIRYTAIASGSSLKVSQWNLRQSEEGISLVAVLRTGPTESLIQGCISRFSAPKTHWPDAVR